MKISSADLRTLERAASIAAAQEELMNSKGDDHRSFGLQAEAGIAAALAVFALISILGLALAVQPPHQSVDGSQVVSLDAGAKRINQSM
jgi:hypothetical protein